VDRYLWVASTWTYSRQTVHVDCARHCDPKTTLPIMAIIEHFSAVGLRILNLIYRLGLFYSDRPSTSCPPQCDRSRRLSSTPTAAGSECGIAAVGRRTDRGPRSCLRRGQCGATRGSSGRSTSAQFNLLSVDRARVGSVAGWVRPLRLRLLGRNQLRPADSTEPVRMFPFSRNI